MELKLKLMQISNAIFTGYTNDAGEWTTKGGAVATVTIIALVLISGWVEGNSV